VTRVLLSYAQARAEAALLPKYKVHVLLAQPNSQEYQARKQPGMVLDGEMLANGVVKTLLDNASCVSAHRKHSLKHHVNL